MGGWAGLEIQNTEEVTIMKNISLWDSVQVLKCKYTEATMKKYFTLGGSHGVPHKSHGKKYKICDFTC